MNLHTYAWISGTVHKLDVWQLFRLQSCLGFADALRQLGPGCLTARRCSIGPEIRVPKIFLPRLISHRPKCKRCKSWQGSPEKFPFMGETLRGAERPQCRFDCPYAASLGRHSRVGVWKIRVSWFGVEGFGASVEGYGQNLPRKPGTLKEHPPRLQAVTTEGIPELWMAESTVWGQGVCCKLSTTQDRDADLCEK